VVIRRGWQTYHELRLDPSTLSADVDVLPGAQRYFFEAPGLARLADARKVEEGETVTELVRLEPGIEAEVKVTASAIRGDDIPVLALRRPSGWEELEGIAVQVGDSQVVYRARFPATRSSWNPSGRTGSADRRASPRSSSRLERRRRSS
jgi:hypothetical protein